VILVDTSVWIDHLHRTEPQLVALLESSSVATHEMVIGELALGGLRDRSTVLSSLAGLVSVTVVTHEELLHFVDQRGLAGVGLSLVDAHLLASSLTVPGTALWTRDKRLHRAAEHLGLAFAASN
jgi:predicted nucleic acid-binding protein